LQIISIRNAKGRNYLNDQQKIEAACQRNPWGKPGNQYKSSLGKVTIQCYSIHIYPYPSTLAMRRLGP
jgi:hypothetical protein